jgi:hypothetical protein
MRKTSHVTIAAFMALLQTKVSNDSFLPFPSKASH